MLKDTTVPFWFSAMNTVFASGLESGTPILVGPPCTGATVMTPSSPVEISAADKGSVAIRQTTPASTRLIAVKYGDAEKMKR
jgi:hypothetical protein